MTTQEVSGEVDGGRTRRVEGTNDGGSGGWRPTGEIVEALDIGVSTVVGVRRRCVEEGLEGGSEP